MSVVDLGNHSAAGGGVTSTTLTVASAVSSGTLVVVFVYDSSTIAQGPSLTDSKSNTYIQGPSLANTAGAVYLYYSFIGSSLTTSDTITFADSTATGFEVMNISAISASGYNAHDAATDNSHADIASTSFSVTGASPAAVSNEIYFGFTSNGGGIAQTPGAGWTISPPSSPTAGFLAAWQINSGTSALTWSGTTGSAATGNSVITSFKPSGGGAVITSLTMTGVGV